MDECLDKFITCGLIISTPFPPLKKKGTHSRFHSEWIIYTAETHPVCVYFCVHTGKHVTHKYIIIYHPFVWIITDIIKHIII